MKDIFAIGCLVLVLILGAVGFFGINYTSTRGGEHNGYVTALESTGIIWQNWKVYFKTDNSSSQEDIYCLPREDIKLLEKLREANEQRKQVLLKYEGMRRWGYGICSGEYITEVFISTN